MTDEKKQVKSAPQQEQKTELANPYDKEVQLPSRGLLYGGRLPGGKVVLSPMTIHEDKILLSAATDKFEAVNTVIEHCLRTKAVPVEELLVGDKMYVFLMLRAISYPKGNEYKFTVACTHCETEFMHVADLNNLQIMALTPEDPEFFTADLPMCGKKVALRRLTGQDEIAIQKFTQSSLKQFSSTLEKGDPAYAFRLALHIVKIDGKEVDRLQALSFCEELYSADINEMSNAIDKNDCGVDLLLVMRCPRCGRSFDQLMPFTAEFFRPGGVAAKRGTGQVP